MTSCSPSTSSSAGILFFFNAGTLLFPHGKETVSHCDRPWHFLSAQWQHGVNIKHWSVPLPHLFHQISTCSLPRLFQPHCDVQDSFLFPPCWCCVHDWNCREVDSAGACWLWFIASRFRSQLIYIAAPSPALLWHLWSLALNSSYAYRAKMTKIVAPWYFSPLVRHALQLSAMSAFISTDLSPFSRYPNEMNLALCPPVHIQAKLGQENLLRMVRWVRWHCPPDTGFEIQTLEVWGRTRYLSVTEFPHNTEFHKWMRKKHFCCFFKPPRPVNEQPSTGVKGSGANHYPRAAAQQIYKFIDQRMLYRGKLVLKHWKELNVSLLPNDEKTCIQSLIHNWKSYSFCVHVSTIHTVTSRDVWRLWHILFNRDL